MIAKTVVTSAVEKLTGANVKLEEINVSLLRGVVDMKGIKIYNPTDYKERLMADIPEIYIDANLRELVKGNFYLSQARLNLEELVAIKNKEEQLNLNSLKVAKKKEEEKEIEKEEKEGNFKIEKLHLIIGTITYIDYTKSPVDTKKYHINIDQTYTNITDPTELARLILVKAVINTAIADFIKVDVNSLSSDLRQALEQTTEKLQEKGKQILESSPEAVEKTKKEIEKATESIKKIFDGEW
jgi:hypothetical protein